jgi:hypothetical protein
MIAPVKVGETFEINEGRWVCIAVTPMAVEWRIDARPVDAHGEATFFLLHGLTLKVLQDA